MKLLMLNYEFPPVGGGAGLAHASLLREFATRSNLQVDVITCGTRPGVTRETFSGRVTIHRVGIHKKSPYFWRRWEVIQWLGRAHRPYQRLLAQNTYGLVHAFFGFPSGWLCYRSRKRLPYIVSLRGVDVPAGNPRFNLEYKLLAPLVFPPIWRHARRMVSCSQGLRRRALDFMPKAAIEVIPNGVDLEHFQPVPERPVSQGLRLITVGRLSTNKRVNMLIDAVALLNQQDCPAHLTVVGDGALYDALNQRIHTAGLTHIIRLTGWCDRDQLPSLYRRSDLYVSSTLHEGMSNAMLEAMASGLPIVTTACEGVDELIGTNGMVTGATPAALAEAIRNLATDPRRRQSMSREARVRAEGFSWRSVAQAYIELYRDLV
jgi:glycosyltransferase involved in cell wall biosynthesis